MQEIKIARISRKTGETKGKKWLRVGVQDENGVWYTAFDQKGNTTNWAEGQTIRVDIEEKEYNGTTQYNIVFPNRLDLLEERIAKLEKLNGIPTNGVLDVRPQKVTEFKPRPEVTDSFTTEEITDDLPF